MILNPWQRKAQEPDRFKYGAWRRPNDTYFRAVALDVTEGPKMNAAHDGSPLQQTYLPLPAILEHLAYERQECERCGGGGYHRESGDPCHVCAGDGRDLIYRKAQEWARRLGLEDG